jgi:hypothetical protein
MSIPLERLYHYIENVARDIRDDTVIYRFIPDGSKKIEDLTGTLSKENFSLVKSDTSPHIFCYDQEPLMFELYQNIIPLVTDADHTVLKAEHEKLKSIDFNLRSAVLGWSNIYDRAVLLHSEQRSDQVTKYQNHQFVPAYYWSHAFIALDWFRYAQHCTPKKNAVSRSTFLIYNRAWSGTREYRLKFLDLLIDASLTADCQTSCNAVDPELQTHYSNYDFSRDEFRPKHCLEQYFSKNTYSSTASADFEIKDYNNCDIEVVLETLFDDSRLHLTEKTLRPIALGKPFLLCATHESLKYLRQYGFKTFGSIINESYDCIEDPVKRLHAVIAVMKTIAQWTEQEKQEKLQKLQEIADYNRRHFFSTDFFDQIFLELKSNLKTALDLVESTNTSKNYIEFRKLRAITSPVLKDILTGNCPGWSRPKQDIIEILKTARQYYNQHHNKY